MEVKGENEYVKDTLQFSLDILENVLIQNFKKQFYMDSLKTAIYAVDHEVAFALHILFISQKFGIPCPIKNVHPFTR